MMRARIGQWLAALLSGGLLAAGYALHPVWWAAWLAPMPLLAAALTAPARRGTWLGAAAGLVAGATTAPYYAGVMGWWVLAPVVARVAFWCGAMVLARRTARRLPPVAAVFALPVFAAAIEVLVLALSHHGSAGSLGYSQMAVLPVVQVASLGGLPAVVFVVMAGGSLGGFALARMAGAAWLDLRGATLAVAAVVGAALGYGGWRLHDPLAGPAVPVALVASDHFAGEATDWAAVWGLYGPAVERAARPGGIVVLPEKIYRGPAGPVVTQLAATARAYQATIVAGIETLDGDAWVNRALIAGPDGRLQTYDKQHPVPGLEARDRPGQTDLLTMLEGRRVGVAICKDMHFPDLGRGYGRAGAQLMAVPAWDFGRDAWLSDRLTSLRGVEAGYAIARSAREGISSISDRDGRIVAEAASGEPVQTVQAMVPLAGGATPYARAGDLFGWSALVMVAGFVLAGWVDVRRLIAAVPRPSRRPAPGSA